MREALPDIIEVLGAALIVWAVDGLLGVHAAALVLGLLLVLTGLASSPAGEPS